MGIFSLNFFGFLSINFFSHLDYFLASSSQPFIVLFYHYTAQRVLLVTGEIITQISLEITFLGFDEFTSLIYT